MQITPDTDVAVLLEDLLSRMREVVGTSLVGLYLFGSLVTGDFDRESSDIDLLAVTASDISDVEFNALERMHTEVIRKHRAWDDRLDIAYVSAAALRTFGRHPSNLAVISPGKPFHRTTSDYGWLMNWYVVQEHGLALFGPPSRTVIRSISKEEFVHVVQEQTQKWTEWIYHMRKRKQQAYVVLTMCRALYTHQNGEQVSKKQAALWAKQELPQWSSLIRDALLWRRAWRDDDVDHDAAFPKSLRFVQFVSRRIATE